MEKIEELADSKAYAMLPRMMRLQDEDMEDDDEEGVIGLFQLLL